MVVTALVKLKVYRTQVKPDEVQRGLTAPLPAPLAISFLCPRTHSCFPFQKMPLIHLYGHGFHSAVPLISLYLVLGAETVLEGDVFVSVKH